MASRRGSQPFGAVLRRAHTADKGSGWRSYAALAAVTGYAPPEPGCEEDVLQAKAEWLLSQTGWLWYHANVSLLDRPGWLDLFACHPARHTVMAVELKTAGGRVSAEQHAWAQGLVASGVPVYIIRPAQWGILCAVADGRATEHELEAVRYVAPAARVARAKARKTKSPAPLAAEQVTR